MIVYVESNFILELAHMREESDRCSQIIGLAKSNQIALVLPAYCVGEPYEAQTRRSKKRVGLYTQLIQEVNELTRSKPYADFLKDSQEITNLLIQSVEEEKKRLDTTLTDLLDFANIIPIEAEIIRAAIGFQNSLNLSPQDALVYASVIAHLEQASPKPKCFLTKNAKDFVNPDIMDQLKTHQCKLLTRFEDGLGYINKNLTDSTKE